MVPRKCKSYQNIYLNIFCGQNMGYFYFWKTKVGSCTSSDSTSLMYHLQNMQGPMGTFEETTQNFINDCCQAQTILIVPIGEWEKGQVWEIQLCEASLWWDTRTQPGGLVTSDTAMPQWAVFQNIIMVECTVKWLPLWCYRLFPERRVKSRPRLYYNRYGNSRRYRKARLRNR